MEVETGYFLAGSLPSCLYFQKSPLSCSEGVEVNEVNADRPAGGLLSRAAWWPE